MLSLLVISDIHATSDKIEDDKCVSYFSTLPDYDNAERNPFVGIPKILRDAGLSVDGILCPGDLADRAEPSAQHTAWKSLVKLKDDLGAKFLLGTVGNHDIDSRLKFSEFDPKSALQSLNPAFPGLSETSNDQYWSRNFAFVSIDDVRFVALNSCAFHGFHSEHPEELKREYVSGRVSDRTIASLKTALQHEPEPKLNVLLVHHHIYLNEHIVANDYTNMKNGDKLVHMLEELGGAPWLIVHGHQHYPSLLYAKGNSISPVVFSAGSLSRKLTGSLAGRSLNQFYHVSLPVDQYATIGWGPCGIIRSWHWTDNFGWKLTPFNIPESANIPSGSGFGCRTQPASWCKDIVSLIEKSPSDNMLWTEVVSALPTLQYVLPSDILKIVDELRKNSSLTVVPVAPEYPVQIGRRKV